MSSLSQKRFSSLAIVFALLFLIGCGGTSEKTYIPESKSAERALDVALEQWKSGLPHGTLDGFDVPIDVYDARWSIGKKKLESYEILREEKAEGPKVFIVNMKLDEDKEPKEVKYYVVGKDPMQVFREADYNKMTGMGG